MTIAERDKLRARRLMHYVDKSENDAAKVAERERRGRVMLNETGALAQVGTVRSGAQNIVGSHVHDRSWNTVPHGIPQNLYPNKERKPRYREQALPEPVRQPREQVLMPKDVAPTLFPQRASDARGRKEGTQPIGIGIRIWESGHDDIVTRRA